MLIFVQKVADLLGVCVSCNQPLWLSLFFGCRIIHFSMQHGNLVHLRNMLMVMVKLLLVGQGRRGNGNS